mmetsp:Transcript_12480/g.29585  ORF Transcript_12480/g.29585 Transcript_12480/m.29585 type:complete len:521 (-) Transcript_12480:332-1894(-)|eukprot:CAMPEP_0197189366 /NCGR_PEP_ID=MMETSP1423-20130617/19649_1 /TAXON_ID=476441 /ORGANISM="Pseudo-nitzschia heimii, Strain UNC1101" /LENGTH=520 /DNA_ID=CAMNT_0042641455 /DNA_START=70 /DNA_END=1632 /DNA_ORIENTATION=+
MSDNSNGYATRGYGSYSGGSGISANSASNGNTVGGDGGLRRRGNTHLNNGGYTNHHYNGNYYSGDDSKRKKSSAVEKLDFMFPKVAEEFTVKTQGGGIATVAAYGLILILALTEVMNWRGQNALETSMAVVDTSLGRKMNIYINITFPALACEDLHLSALDVAGDSQINIDDSMKKKQLHLDGSAYSQKEMDVELNQHRVDQERKLEILRKDLPDGYCGPCYGAHETEDQCCNTCDEVTEAYSKRKWKTQLLQYTAEQCVREGRDKSEPKKMVKGQGCNLAGHMTVNRVAGNFHVAMGEGIERDGKHIHTYNPDDAINFNASHVVHHLSFGSEGGTEPLNGSTKIVTEAAGSTGLFQYFVKVVPTTYVGDGANIPEVDEANAPPTASPNDSGKRLETNSFFFTERFLPLMTDMIEDEHYEDDEVRVSAESGFTGGHANKEHHTKQNAVLPGVFFIYEIYPFALEITQNEVPFTHLLIRLMATIGGVFTLARWLDSILDGWANNRNRGANGRSPTKFSVNT